MLGGTFDPIHIGHLLLAESAREQLGLDSVLFVPAAVQWRKARADVSEARRRVEMVRLAIAGNPAFALCTLEVERGGPSYTAETLEQLAAMNPGAELYLILGEDAFNDLPNWYDPGRIVALATIAVAPRSGGVEARAHPWLRERGVRLVRVEMPRIEVSATMVRERVAAGRSVRYLVPEAVLGYIERYGLYRR